MAAVAADEDWQTTRPTITERTKFIFNNQLLSDVKFIVPILRVGNSMTKEIPAHKLVLAISSPVFYAMFYGKMAETKNSIRLPDCTMLSLLEFLRYIYSDEIDLTGRNVMQVLYLARKYMVPSLVDKCNEFLQNNLEADNVLEILPEAQRLKDEEVEERCWKVIKAKTMKVVTSFHFELVDRVFIESIVNMDGLDIKEVELFKAVDRWAIKQSQRPLFWKKVPPPSGEKKREIIGEEILHAIRFPLMSLKEFSPVVIDCNILTMDEINLMVKYYADVPSSPLPFTQAPRIAGSFQRCRRFGRLVPVEKGGWYYRGSSNEIRLAVNKDIILHGVQHFGSEGGEYKVSIKIKEIRENASGSCIAAEQSGSYFSKKSDTDVYHGFDVMFDEAVCLESGKIYEITSDIKGPDSWYGLEGKPSVECGAVTFHFSRACSFVTDVFRGQFPALIFTLYE